MSTVDCPALLVSATHSGAGKTSVTAALARHYRRRGLRVRAFKTGPDFIDPGLLEQASGAPVHQLDLWMVGEAGCRRLLHEAAQQADLILVEGVMGLYDGEPSSADLAERLGLPVLAVLDAAAQAQTFGAVALGLASYRPQLRFAGVLANRVAGAGHAAMLRDSLPPGLPWCGWLPGAPEAVLPERHLGLVLAEELPDLDLRLDTLAQALQLELLELPQVSFAAPPEQPLAQQLAGVRIAVARDAAFAFLYRANLELLQVLGAELAFFSPLAGDALPQADAVYLPGGYPELYLSQLSRQHALRDALQAMRAAGKPILAECGGMLALFDSLAGQDGAAEPMWGLLPGEARLQPRLAALGLQQVALPEGTLRGHTFHYSTATTPLTPLTRAQSPSGTPGEAVYRSGRLTASYLHLYFPSNPQATAALFRP